VPVKCSSQPPVQTHTVEVGAHNQLLFNPNQVDAAIGDEVRFEFRKFNHTVIQSSLDKPCLSLGGFDTGFTRFNGNDSRGNVISFTVQTMDPQWFFCRQRKPRGHCQAGMVFAINPGDLMNRFLDNARQDSEGTTNTESVSITAETSSGIMTQSSMQASSESSTLAASQPTTTPKNSNSIISTQSTAQGSSESVATTPSQSGSPTAATQSATRGKSDQNKSVGSSTTQSSTKPDTATEIPGLASALTVPLTGDSNGVAPTAFEGTTASNLVSSGVIGLGTSTATSTPGSTAMVSVSGTTSLLTTLCTIIVTSVL
jgi:plastocyanin